VTVVVPQRGLTNLKVHLADAVLEAKYAFPFWDDAWKVRFVMLDLLGAPAVLLPAPVESASVSEIRSRAVREALRPLADARPSSFSGAFHLDVAWVLRGMTGLPEALRHAILSTNLAGKGKAGSEKVHDAEFDERLGSLTWIVTKDRTFVTRRYERARLPSGTLK
jgi:hypothetical protein